MTAWHEDDELWDEAIGWMLRERAEKASEEVEHLLELTGVRPPGSVLDLACGVGRHSLELARQGFRVTGVDRTSSFLEEAARAAESEELDIEFVEEDMRRFRRPEAFDLAVNLLTSFGYFEDPADDAKVVHNLHESLRGGGVVVFDLMGKEVLASIFQARDWKETNGDFWLFEREVTDDWSWMQNRWIVIRDGQRKEFHLAHRIYAATELTRLLTDCGFAETEVYGDLDGSPYDNEASRLVVVGRK